MCGVVPSLSHTPSCCAQGQLNVTFIRLYKHCHGTYLCAIFMTFFHFIHWELEVYFLSITEHCYFENNDSVQYDRV
jgi:hypothetical protein